AALEAIAAGAPLVVTDVGGLGEAVTNLETGLSCPPGDSAALAAAVIDVLDDPAAAQQRALAARQRLTADFDWRTVAARTARVYGDSTRGAHRPIARRPIIEQALPDR
ncbi:MAG: glycosyltransferase, partial [Mycobacterium sp.]|nr:glycosyltransferase [Mycobacterium sp.]